MEEELEEVLRKDSNMNKFVSEQEVTDRGKGQHCIFYIHSIFTHTFRKHRHTDRLAVMFSISMSRTSAAVNHCHSVVFLVAVLIYTS